VTRTAALLLVLFAAGACAAPAQTRARETPRDAAREGVAYLLRAQNSNGSWGSPRATTGFDVLASPPGSHDAFRLGTTALCVMALGEASKTDPTAAAARLRGLEFLLERGGELRRANGMELYNVWGHGFAAQALAEAYPEHREAPLGARIRAAWDREIAALERYETAWGGWNYYDFAARTQTPSMEPTSFTTSTVLAAFEEGKRAGLPAPERLVERALRIVEKCRKPDGSYLYDFGHRYHPMHPANQMKGSLGRAQACNFALAAWGRLDAGALRGGLEALFAEHRFIEIGRKRQWPHEGWYANAPYYYYYGHYYAARIVERMDLEDRAEFAPKLRDVVLPHQEPDGSWWDYNMYDYGKPYGTALALMILQRLEEKRDK
jgi:hypothetical protein